MLRVVLHDGLLNAVLDGRAACATTRSGPTSSGFMRGWKMNYELKERANVLTRKLRVIPETANTLSDIIDTQRSLPLKQIIVALILLENVVQMRWR